MVQYTYTLLAYNAVYIFEVSMCNVYKHTFYVFTADVYKSINI